MLDSQILDAKVKRQPIGCFKFELFEIELSNWEPRCGRAAASWKSLRLLEREKVCWPGKQTFFQTWWFLNAAKSNEKESLFKKTFTFVMIWKGLWILESEFLWIGPSYHWQKRRLRPPRPGAQFGSYLVDSVLLTSGTGLFRPSGSEKEATIFQSNSWCVWIIATLIFLDFNFQKNPQKVLTWTAKFARILKWKTLFIIIDNV